MMKKNMCRIKHTPIMQRPPPPSMQMPPEKVLSGRANLFRRNLQDVAGRRATARAELEKLDREYAVLQGRLRELQAGASRTLQQNQRFVRG